MSGVGVWREASRPRATRPVTGVPLPCALFAQHGYSDPSNTYDPNVPTPRAILGYEIGERFTPHRLLMRNVERIAAASRRMKVDTVARSFEGREMLILTVSSKRNLSRLKEIQADAQRVGDPRGVSASDLEAATKRLPAIVWIAHSVHGGEASGAEAGLALLYQLAAGTDAETQLVLDSTIVLIDPAENPDGRERHTHDALDQRIGYPASLIDAGFVVSGALDHFNVLIVPSVPGAQLDRVLGESGVKRLADWVRAGGVLVTLDGASAWLASEHVGLSRLRELRCHLYSAEGPARWRSRRPFRAGEPRSTCRVISGRRCRRSSRSRRTSGQSASAPAA